MRSPSSNSVSEVSGFLAQVSPNLRDALNQIAVSVRLDTGETLFEEGDDGDALFAIIKGAVEISVLSPEGRRLVLDVLRQGDMLGEIALFDPGVRTATVTALEPTHLRRLSHRDLLSCMRTTPDMAEDMLRLAGRRMRWMTHQIEEQVFLPVAQRLARRLLYLTAASPDKALELSQTQLAEFVGATREAVSKILSEWRRAEIVAVSRAGVQIIDRDALEDIARR